MKTVGEARMGSQERVRGLLLDLETALSRVTLLRGGCSCFSWLMAGNRECGALHPGTRVEGTAMAGSQAGEEPGSCVPRASRR